MDEIILRRTGLIKQEEDFANDEQRLLDELRHEEGRLNDDIFVHQVFCRFKDGADAKIQTIRIARKILQDEIEKLTAQILELHIEQKKYIKIHEMQFLKQNKMLQIKTQQELDKFGILNANMKI